MSALSQTAMVLAAGLGTRMRPLTLTTPKPLVEVGGRAMLDYALDKLVQAGIKRAVVNTFYLAEQIEAHLKTRTDIETIVSRETILLDTGGGIKQAIAHFEHKPFFALNADIPWFDGAAPGLPLLRKRWCETEMDALLLVMPTAKPRGFPATGDFNFAPDGRLQRRYTLPPRSHVYIGAQIVRPELFAAMPEQIFSTNRIWDAAEQRQRLYGVEHGGTCYHVGTERDWVEANALLASGQGWAVP